MFKRLIQTGPVTAALCAMAAVTFFTLNDVSIKLLSGGYALHQIMLIRSIIGILVLLCIFMPMQGGFAILKTKQLGFHLMRGMAVVFANLTFFLGLAELQVAEATAIFFVSPLLITLFSIIFLKEQVGIHRWSALVVGMIGILVILRPGTDAFKLVSLLPIAAAIGYAALNVMTRYSGKTESALTMSFYIQMTLIMISLGFWICVGDGRYANPEHTALYFLLREWTVFNPGDWYLFLIIGFGSATGGFLIAQAYRQAEAAYVAPFEYIAMPLSIFWGFMIFQTIPDGQSLIGMTLVVASGLYCVWRESIKHKNIHDEPRGSPRYRR